MSEQPPDGPSEYKENVAAYDPELDDPDDDATGYENDTDALGDEGVE